ncbi:hypothetical protein LEP1GSC038_0419 [Leptospira weilii str. 2006001855]|uniref:Uncharacterized protein n=1 Tax=Leptospira weilii str. 2006001855 TaxID=996804 RepID=M6FN24_9LEPT|nr:hypothetical protein LEP1GSC038_0419 [Leptospira weilii str. 2006001855]
MKIETLQFFDDHHTIEKFESFRFFLNEISPIFSLDFKIREKNLVPKRRKWLIPRCKTQKKELGGNNHDI